MILLQNQLITNGLETWYVAFGTWLFTMTFQMMTLTFLMARSNMGKCWNKCSMGSFGDFGLKLVFTVSLMSTLWFMSTKGQGHSLTFDLGLS